MWFDAPADAQSSRYSGLLVLTWVCLLLGPALATEAKAADDADIPPQCSVTTSDAGRQIQATDDTLDNCIEFGAAVGELGLEWRKKLPGNVRWVVRKDASQLCDAQASDMGKKLNTPVPGAGCIFVSPKVCTIVTDRYISHAALGNAVRECADH